MKVRDVMQLKEGEDNFVCFLDILGFTDLVKSENRQEHLKKIVGAVEQRMGFDNVAHPYLSYIFISDSIIIACREKYFRHLLWKVCQIQGSLLDIGFALRGGIDYGDAYTITVGASGNGDAGARGLTIFGQAYINAYKMESGSAKYPRVLISPNAVQAGKTQPKGDKYVSLLVDMDQDGWSFVNAFKRIANYDKLVTSTATGGYRTPQKKLKRLHGWAVTIDKNIKAAGADRSKAEKWCWLRAKIYLEMSLLELEATD